jgi:hypothetical protein
MRALDGHRIRYISSGGTDGHLYEMGQPGRPERTVPSLLLTTTDRNSGQKFVFPLFYGRTGDSYFVFALKRGARWAWCSTFYRYLGKVVSFFRFVAASLVYQKRPARSARHHTRIADSSWFRCTFL